MPEKLFLADLEADPGEQHNRAEQAPEIRDRLLRLREELTAEFAAD